MIKSELAAKMAGDLDAFMNRGNQVQTLKPETAQDIADKRAQNRFYNDSVYDAEMGGTTRDQYGRMASRG